MPGETPTSPSLHDEVRQLEQRKVDLERQLVDMRAAVDTLHEQLRLLKAGLFGKRRWPLVLLIVAVALAGLGYGGVAFYMGQRKYQPLATRHVVHRPLVPRLLVTSRPVPARVLLDGVTRGDTPLLLELGPPTRTITVEVQAAGYHPLVRRWTVNSVAGRHWHADLGSPAQE